MRAATRCGYVFIGSQAALQQPTQVDKRARVILPDPTVTHDREQAREALRQCASQLERMMTEAVEPEEIAFWQAALARLKGGD